MGYESDLTKVESAVVVVVVAAAVLWLNARAIPIKNIVGIVECVIHR